MTKPASSSSLAQLMKQKREARETETHAQGAPPAYPAPVEQPAPHAPEAPEPTHNAPPAYPAPHAHNAPHAQYAIVPTEYTSVPNDIWDEVMPTLEVHDQAVLWSLYRLARGWGKDTCTISNETLSKRANCSERQIQISTARLAKIGLITKLAPDLANTNKLLRGNVYQINLPGAQYTSSARGAGGAQPAPGARYAPNKEKALKEKDIKGNSPKITRLTPEEKTETLQMIADLITKSGYSFEQAEKQFGGNLTPEDWTAIRMKVEEQNWVTNEHRDGVAQF